MKPSFNPLGLLDETNVVKSQDIQGWENIGNEWKGNTPGGGSVHSMNEDQHMRGGNTPRVKSEYPSNNY